MMSWSAKCSWKELTPGRVPVGARISAGKLGSVDRSLPKLAVSLVNRLPGQLHAVAGVTGEPDDHAVELDDALHETAGRELRRDGASHQWCTSTGRGYVRASAAGVWIRTR